MPQRSSRSTAGLILAVLCAVSWSPPRFARLSSAGAGPRLCFSPDPGFVSKRQSEAFGRTGSVARRIMKFVGDRRAGLCRARNKAHTRRCVVRCSAAANNDSNVDDSNRERAKYARESILNWVDGRMDTLDGRAIGRGLFLAAASERKQRADQGIATLRDNLQEYVLQQGPSDQRKRVAEDSVFLAIYLKAAQGDGWLGAEAWSNAMVLQASVPGLAMREVSRAVLQDISPDVVTAEEVNDVVDAFVTANWGNARDNAGTIVASLVEYAATQFCIGVLWGYSLRGLVLRLSLDRSLGTSPESAAAARRRLERQLAIDFDGSEGKASSLGNSTSVPSSAPTSLLNYATEFFGHSDWANLCAPTEASMGVFEKEVEEMMSGLIILASSGFDLDDDDVVVVRHIQRRHRNDDDGDEDEDEDEIDIYEGNQVLLEYEDWVGFQGRAVALGALIAGAEAFVESELGQLPRSSRPMSRWTRQLVRNGALTGVRREQALMLLKHVGSPLRRLVNSLRNTFLVSKLADARRGISRIFSGEAADVPDSPRESEES